MPTFRNPKQDKSLDSGSCFFHCGLKFKIYLGFCYLIFGISGLSGLGGCTAKKTEIPSRTSHSLLSAEIRNEIRNVEKSIIGIGTIVNYDIQKFEYPAAEAPGLVNGKSVTTEKDEKTLTGGGLIIKVSPDNRKFTILTSAHLVAPKDTLEIYYLDEDGRRTDQLFARSILKQVIITVRGKSNWRAEAALIAVDVASDLAIIAVETENLLGFEFANPVGYDLDLSWGDWVFLFGYPKGIKQMTGGWVSESPYPGTHTVDAVVRSGFSGGPIFAISRDGTNLTFVGLIKSVPRSTIDYIAPDESMPIGFQLNQEQLEKLVVKRQILVDYGTAYFVNANSIKKFFARNRNKLLTAGIRLLPKYYD